MPQEQKTKVLILKEFRDKDSFATVYKVDSEVEFEASRAKMLAGLGLVKIEGTKPSEQGDDPVAVDLTKAWNQIRSDVKKSTDVNDLKSALEAEKAAEKPRESVLKDLAERIEELEKTE